MRKAPCTPAKAQKKKRNIFLKMGAKGLLIASVSEAARIIVSSMLLSDRI